MLSSPPGEMRRQDKYRLTLKRQVGHCALYVVCVNTHAPGFHLPCILLCVVLIRYVSVLLLVYCWALIIFKWFISYDDGFWFV